MRRKWLLITQKSIDAIGEWAKGHGLLDSLKELDIEVASYDGPDFRLSTDPPLLPCNCGPRSSGFHSSECAGYYEDTPEGIRAYEDYLGHPYVR